MELSAVHPPRVVVAHEQTGGHEAVAHGLQPRWRLGSTSCRVPHFRMEK